MNFKEERYPLTESGERDRRYYTDPLEYYTRMYEEFLARQRTGPATIKEVGVNMNRRIFATEGLIAKGVAAVPYAASLLSHKDPDAREDAATILGELGRQPAVVDHLLRALEEEDDETVRSSIILSLGAIRAKKAIPALAAIIRDPAAGGDTDWNAVESLGRIVRKRFVNQPEPVKAALEWLDAHGV